MVSVGDKVRRIKEETLWMTVGDIHTVTCVKQCKDWVSIELDGYPSCTFMMEYFEVVDEEGR